MSIRTDLVSVACPKCGAEVGELCRRLSPGRFTHVDDFHDLRWRAFRDEDEAPSPVTSIPTSVRP